MSKTLKKGIGAVLLAGVLVGATGGVALAGGPGGGGGPKSSFTGGGSTDKTNADYGWYKHWDTGEGYDCSSPGWCSGGMG